MARASRLGWPRVAIAIGVAAAAVWVSLDARAYCLTSACGEEVARTLCSPAHEDDCGEPLRWRTRCTGFSVQEGGSRGVSTNATEDLVQNAFDVWMKVDCGEGRPPGLVVQDLGRVTCTELEYNSDGGNANIVVYREQKWPHESSGHNVALTTTTFDPDTGELFDADIELNAANFELTTGDENVAYDLEGVLVHETGHFLGLGHSDTLEATMYFNYQEGDTSLRDLDADDIAAICELYPPKKGLADTCNPLPPHGFSPDCKDVQVEGDCSVGSGGPARGGGAGWRALVAGLVATLARRAAARGAR